MDEVAIPRNGLVIFIEIAAAAIGIPIKALQDRELITSVRQNYAGNARSIVRSVRLKLPGHQGVAIALPFRHKVADRIRLVTVGDNGLSLKKAHRMIDDQRRILQLGRIICLGADAVLSDGEDTVAAVLAATHNKIGNDCGLIINGTAQHDAPSGIRVGAELVGKIQRFHICFLLNSSDTSTKKGRTLTRCAQTVGIHHCYTPCGNSTSVSHIAE